MTYILLPFSASGSLHKGHLPSGRKFFTGETVEPATLPATLTHVCCRTCLFLGVMVDPCNSLELVVFSFLFVYFKMV